MERYKEVSQQIFVIFRRFTPLVEPLSLDEAFLDVTGSTRLFGPAEEIAAKIKQLVKQETGLTVSAGVAPLKFIAKIASDFHKPDGLTVVTPDRVEEFLTDLPIDKLWGIGKVTEKTLAQLGVRTVGDLRRIPPEVLEAKLGKHGVHLHLLSCGIDDREVIPERDVKSIGHEETFTDDIVTVEQAEKELLYLSEKAVRRLRRHRLLAATITLKVKYHDFKQGTRSVTLAGPVNDRRTVFRQSAALLAKTAVGKKPVRLLGVSLSGLTDEAAPHQRSLFADNPHSPHGEKLDTALDDIQDRFGEDAIVPGTLLKK
jgi:DNA polymerase-4